MAFDPTAQLGLLLRLRETQERQKERAAIQQRAERDFQLRENAQNTQIQNELMRMGENGVEANAIRARASLAGADPRFVDIAVGLSKQVNQQRKQAQQQAKQQQSVDRITGELNPSDLAGVDTETAQALIGAPPAEQLAAFGALRQFSTQADSQREMSEFAQRQQLEQRFAPLSEIMRNQQAIATGKDPTGRNLSPAELQILQIRNRRLAEGDIEITRGPGGQLTIRGPRAVSAAKVLPMEDRFVVQRELVDELAETIAVMEANPQFVGARGVLERGARTALGIAGDFSGGIESPEVSQALTSFADNVTLQIQADVANGLTEPEVLNRAQTIRQDDRVISSLETAEFFVSYSLAAAQRGGLGGGKVTNRDVSKAEGLVGTKGLNSSGRVIERYRSTLKRMEQRTDRLGRRIQQIGPVTLDDEFLKRPKMGPAAIKFLRDQQREAGNAGP